MHTNVQNNEFGHISQKLHNLYRIMQKLTHSRSRI